jgi:hypothetical protein
VQVGIETFLKQRQCRRDAFQDCLQIGAEREGKCVHAHIEADDDRLEKKNLRVIRLYGYHFRWINRVFPKQFG